jgi:hypothetical protein
MLQSGMGHGVDAVHAYLHARLADPAAVRPALTPWRKMAGAD